MTRQHILDEIRRTTKANGGVPLGRDRFQQVTGIRYTEWWGRHWSRWSDAVREAGFTPNQLQGAYEDDELVEKLIGLIREIRRFAATGDLRLKKRSDASFPNDKVRASHFGSTSNLRKVVIDYCGSHPGFDDIPSLGRSEYELAIQLPGKLSTVHVIKTDDPDGIEAYWHKRFAAKRGNGEWFSLDNSDVTAFKRRKFMWHPRITAVTSK
jgi:hypothetical protein